MTSRSRVCQLEGKDRDMFNKLSYTGEQDGRKEGERNEGNGVVCKDTLAKEGAYLYRWGEKKEKSEVDREGEIKKLLK